MTANDASAHVRQWTLEIDADTCKNGHGDRMDLSLAVDGIFSLAA